MKVEATYICDQHGKNHNNKKVGSVRSKKLVTTICRKVKISTKYYRLFRCEMACCRETDYRTQIQQIKNTFYLFYKTTQR